MERHFVASDHDRDRRECKRKVDEDLSTFLLLLSDAILIMIRVSKRCVCHTNLIRKIKYSNSIDGCAGMGD